MPVVESVLEPVVIEETRALTSDGPYTNLVPRWQFKLALLSALVSQQSEAL